MSKPLTEVVQAAITQGYQKTDPNKKEKPQHEINREQYLAFVYSTVNQFCDKYPAFNRGGLRSFDF